MYVNAEAQSAASAGAAAAKLKTHALVSHIAMPPHQQGVLRQHSPMAGDTNPQSWYAPFAVLSGAIALSRSWDDMRRVWQM
jgi:hypothetical protein